MIDRFTRMGAPHMANAEVAPELHIVRTDLAQSLGLLCIGAAGAATLNVTVPRSWLDHLTGSSIGSILTLSVLAVLIAVCSEADAFIASSLTQFSLTARLAFMVVGPAIDMEGDHVGRFQQLVEAGAAAGVAERRQQKANQDANDANDHQQLNQSKPFANWRWTNHVTSLDQILGQI